MTRGFFEGMRLMRDYISLDLMPFIYPDQPYIGGSVSSPEWKAEAKRIKEEVYDHKCQSCGDIVQSRISKKKIQLHCHHIDMNPRNNDESNLIALCGPCHREFHEFQKRICPPDVVGTN